jgi:glycosyltransferase involved in cell wall biosynthesis
MTQRITGLVNTRDAGATLALCLESLAPHVDELLVVDMESSDDTVAIAESFGAHVLTHEPLGYVEPAREFGIAAASHDWILVLDADEVIPASLGTRLREIADHDEADVVVFSWRNYLFGGVPEDGPLSPRIDRHRRFFKRHMLVHSEGIHVPAEPVSGARQLILPPSPELCVSHFAYVDISEWLERSDRYTTIEARALVRQGGQAPTTRSMLVGTLRTFAREYVKRRGYRAGWRGLHVSLLLAHYHLITGLKAQQLVRSGDPEDVRARYRQLAEELIRPGPQK